MKPSSVGQADHGEQPLRPNQLVYPQGERPLHEVLSEHARTRPQDPAILWYGRTLSYSEVANWVNRFARYLRTLGVERGHRVALYLHNSPQYLIAHYAILQIGAIVGPCSPAFKALEVAYEVSDMDASVMVTADSLYSVVQEARSATKLEHVIVTHYGDLLPEQPAWRVPDELRASRQPTPGAIDFFAAIESMGIEKMAQEQSTRTQLSTAPTGEDGAIDLDDVSLLVYTSGSTGRPKGAMLSYRNALFKTAASALANGVRTDDTMLAVMPVSHIAGMLMGLNIPIYIGCPVVLMYRFDPVSVLEAIERARVTWWYSTAPMNVALMNAAQINEYDLSSLRTNVCTSFGIQLTEALAQRWREFTGGCPVYEAAYGLSETHTADTYMPSEAVRWGTQGRPIYETEIRIVDPLTGLEQPVGEQGEITIRSPGVFKGYWRNPEASERTLRGGFVYTGDIGMLDADGYLTFLGRSKEMMKVSGFSVFPEDVEALLLEHPSVLQVAVVGVPDEKRGEVVKAFVVLKPTARETVNVAQLLEWAKLHMASYKVPREIEFKEALPMSSTGKVLRRMLLPTREDTP